MTLVETQIWWPWIWYLVTLNALSNVFPVLATVVEACVHISHCGGGLHAYFPSCHCIDDTWVGVGGSPAKNGY